MIVKRYVVKDMPEALTKIRQDLGHDAVILSTKKIKSRGFLGLFSVTQLEVVAAANDNEPALSSQTTAGKRRPAQAAKTSMPEKATRPSRPLPEKEPGVASPSGQETEILKEVQELRGVLTKFLYQNPDVLPDSVRKIKSELVANDVSPELAETLIMKILKENEEIHLLEEQEFRHILTNLISKEIHDSVLPTPLAPESRIVAFVGPTGVGKTTTIAKIAANELLKNKRKVGFITADTYRIAAVEQLKTYANILQLPVEVVFSTEEIQQAIEKLEDRDLILIDTAGRNYGDTVFVDQLNKFLKASEPDETCLVLSLTTKASDLEHIVENFEGVSIDKFIFTKLDETNSFGAIYNLTHRYRKPLAYLTTGQNVPDDIEVATPEQIARLVVGEKRYV